jgi:pimeloyl-ACP methyl ester carboxylesterase
LRTTPAWPRLESFAHALDYDVTLHGPGQSMQADVLGRIAVPTLVIAGSGALDWVLGTARAVAAAVPGAGHRILDGEDHGVLNRPAALAPVLLEFFRAGRLSRRPGSGPSPRRPGP